MYAIEGIVTNAELEKLAKDTVIYYSGRMCGWCGVKFVSYGVSDIAGPDHGKFVQVHHGNEADAERPTLLEAGNLLYLLFFFSFSSLSKHTPC
jgi:hypothetical protein